MNVITDLLGVTITVRRMHLGYPGDGRVGAIRAISGDGASLALLVQWRDPDGRKLELVVLDTLNTNQIWIGDERSLPVAAGKAEGT